jgi:hypothetical protein
LVKKVRELSMHKPNRTKALSALALLGGLALSIFIAAPTVSAQQTRITFNVQKRFNPVPMEIAQVLVDGKPVAVNTPVTVPADWYRKTTVVLRNVTSKVIDVAQINSEFPESGDGKSAATATEASGNHIGRYPQSVFLKKDGTYRNMGSEMVQPEVRIFPGESVTLALTSGQATDEIAAKRAGHPISEVHLVLSDAWFEDGTKWGGGFFWKRHTSGPSEQIPAAAYFEPVPSLQN